MSTAPDVESVALHEATRRRYLNYALSVITSRALPDVRDGLKPVQRRILYAMFNDLKLLPDGRYRKSAAVVGEVMAKYHPHGDSSIYEAMVRMAQPFSLRHPLVDGQGNFGSMDGDNAAAMRYTECKLQKLAVNLLDEIKKQTVDFRPTYDGQKNEPVVLPAQFPQLLVNGAEGIAVGMATRIPPHNLRDVIDAAVTLIDDPEADAAALARKLKGPDFPTGGVILNSRAELAEIYQEGRGSVHVRGRWDTEQKGRKHHVIITEIPYAVNKATLVERIGQHIAERKLPLATDVRDESTDEVRIVIELKRREDAEPVMAYLFKHTPLQSSFHVNLTCLIPTDDPDLPAQPLRCDIHQVLRAWLDFRYVTVRRRYEYDLRVLRERIHILRGFVVVFDALDEAIALIRASEGRRDAHERLIDRFDLDDIQAEKVLDLQLYKLAKMAIDEIRRELEEKLAEAERIEAILASTRELWSVVRGELQEIRRVFGEKRRTDIGIEQEEVIEYSETDFIIGEQAFLIVTRDGWIKRQGSFTELAKIRIREGDEIGWIARGNTKKTATFFTDQGAAYVMRLDDVPATTGYGEPIQAQFSFSDGERVVGVVMNDATALPPPVPWPDGEEADPAPPHGVAMTRQGRIIRFPMNLHEDVSTRSGRKVARLAKGDAVVSVEVSDGSEHVSVASRDGHALCFPIDEVSIVKGAAKGVTGIKLGAADSVLAFELTRESGGGCVVETTNGREEIVRPSKYSASRAGKGRLVLRRGGFVSWRRGPVRYDLRYSAEGEE